MSADSIPSKSTVPFQRLTLMLALASYAACLIIAFTAPNPLYLAPFRESQTAISADYLVREPAGGMLAYQLPVLGVPWRLPLEFPLFQKLTAWVAVCGIDVAQAGRLVSLVGFLGCLLVGSRIWRDCKLPAQWHGIALALLAASPIYCLYATSHMIESWALFPALLMLWCALRFALNGSWLCLGIMILAACLSSMIKITTWLPAGFLVSLYMLGMLHEMWKKQDFKLQLPRWIGLLAVMAIGMAAGLLWTVWAAHVRAPHGAGAGGSDSWVFGNLAIRLSAKNWILLAGKDLFLLFGPLGVLVPFLLAGAWWKGGGAANRLNRCMVFGLAGYLVHALAFITLLLRHDYYVFGSGVFILFATLCALMVLTESVNSAWIRALPPALAFSMLIGILLYGTTKRGYRDYGVDQAIQTVAKIKEPGALLTFNFDWSARLPFEVHRKALMLTEDLPEKELTNLLETNREVPFAAIVVLGHTSDHLARLAAARLGFDADQPVMFWRSGYLLFKPGAAKNFSADNPHMDLDDPIINELNQRIPPKTSLTDGLVFFRLPFSGKPGDWFEVIAKRGNDAFFYRLRGNSLVRVRNFFDKP